MKKIIYIVIAISIIGGVWYSFNKKSEVKNNEPIKIGVVSSLTGDLQSWGQESKNSIQLAVDEINSKGGIDGRKIEMIYEDGACSASKAVSAARKLIAVDGVKIIIPFCSQEALSIAPIALENKVIEFVPDATIPELTNINDYVFRISPSDKVAIQVLVDDILKNHKTIAILTENNAFSKSLENNFLNYFDKSKIVFSDTYNPETRDFRSVISKMKIKKPDAVFINANTSITAGTIIKQMSELGISLPSYGVYFGSDPEFVRIAGKSAEGFTYVEFIADSNSESVKKFLDNYKTKYKEEAPHPQFAVLSYDAMYVIKNAIESVGDDTENLKSYLKNLKEVKTTLGNFGINNGDIDGNIFKLRQIKNGEPVSVQ